MGTEQAAAHRQVESIQKVAGQMEVRIKTLLDTAALEDGHFSIERAACYVENLLRETTDLFVDQAQAKQVGLRWHTDSSGLPIEADRGRMIEMISNLIANALKFTPAGGTVVASARTLGTETCFSVSDTGSGVDSTHVPHLFERFWKAEVGGKKGTGLGLFIAKGIVEAHGGRIWVDNVLGKGTTVSFTIQSPGGGLRPTESRAPAGLHVPS